MFQPVYLDHNATTPVDAEVLEAMLPYFSQCSGNASSRHEYGRAAMRAMEAARQQVAAAVNAQSNEVVFVSGGTEANNLFLRGVSATQGPGLLAISAVELPSVRETAKALRGKGWQTRAIAVDAAGRVDAKDYAATLLARPTLISVMLANNETGVIQDVAMLARQARPVQAWFHVDAVQALGKLPLDFRALNESGVHALALSAHKVGGPKGAGALVIDRRLELAAQMTGGGQERGLRSGTENIAAIVGFGAACELAAARPVREAEQIAALRDELEQGLRHHGATLFGAEAGRLPNTSFFSLPGIDGETLVGKLDRAGYAVASGAACSSVNPEPSHVLLAMGVAAETARGAIRVSISRCTTAQDIAGFLVALADTTRQLRGLTALAA